MFQLAWPSQILKESHWIFFLMFLGVHTEAHYARNLDTHSLRWHNPRVRTLHISHSLLCCLRRAIRAALPLDNDHPLSPLLQRVVTPSSMIVQSQVKIRGGMELTVPQHRDSIPGWRSGVGFAIRKIVLCSPGLFIYSHGKESSWSSWHKGWASSPQEWAQALYCSDTSPASYFCSTFKHQKYHSCRF